MKAPDKIFVPTRFNLVDGLLVRESVTDEEYIRKDALMEWIQEVRAIPHENAITRDLAFQEVINKLNSM